MVKVVGRVGEDQLAMVCRFGKVRRWPSGRPMVWGPGPAWLIPFVDTLHIVSTAATTLRIPRQHVMLKDHSVFTVAAAITIAVDTEPQEEEGYRLFSHENVHKALFAADNLDDITVGATQAAVHELTAHAVFADMADPAELAQSILMRVAEILTDYGLRIVSLWLTECAPTAHTEARASIRPMVADRMAAVSEAANLWRGDPHLQHMHPGVAAAVLGIPPTATIPTATRGGQDADAGAW